MRDMSSEHRTTPAWIGAGWPPPSEIEAKLHRIEHAWPKPEAAVRRG